MERALKFSEANADALQRPPPFLNQSHYSKAIYLFISKGEMHELCFFIAR
jgi:hypothetical protein